VSRQIHIGTSGWHYKHWLGKFYPADLKPADMLAHYVRQFDTVELNNSFYHLPAETTFEAWRKNTPAGFRFAVKGSRFITHMKKLGNVEEGTSRFIERVEILGRKLGPVLFQLPPKWKRNPERLRTFLQSLPRSHRYTFEFREPSWLDEEIYAILREFKAAFCIYELEFFQSPVVITADWTYVRLHGPGLKYQGRYGREGLKPWAELIEEWRRSLRQIYVYFDNDQSGYAARDALELKELVAA
jgi:uncharacterized protein YecE (DUF72 family)